MFGDLEVYAFRLGMVVEVDADGLRVKFVDVVVPGHLESPSGSDQRADAVEGVDALGAALVAVAEQVPAPLVLLDAVRVDMKHLSFVLAVFAVHYFEGAVILHRGDDAGQMDLAGRDVLDRYATGQALPAEGEQVIDGEGVDQPAYGGFTVYGVLAVTDEIAVGTAVAFDFDSEDLRYGLAMVVEGPAVIRSAVATLPAGGDLVQRETGFSNVYECLDEPDVFVDELGYHQLILL